MNWTFAMTDLNGHFCIEHGLEFMKWPRAANLPYCTKCESDGQPLQRVTDGKPTAPPSEFMKAKD